MNGGAKIRLAARHDPTIGDDDVELFEISKGVRSELLFSCRKGEGGEVGDKHKTPFSGHGVHLSMGQPHFCRLSGIAEYRFEKSISAQPFRPCQRACETG